MNPKDWVKGNFASTPVWNKVVPAPKFDMSSESLSPKKPQKSYIDKICEAISIVGVKGKGASLQAIQKYILENFEYTEEKRVKTFLKKSLKKGLDDGILSRPAKSKQVSGAVGYFQVNDKASGTAKNTKKASALKTQKATETLKVIKNKGKGHSSDTEVTINVAKKTNKKRSNSVSELPAEGKVKTKQTAAKETSNETTPIAPNKTLKGTKRTKPVKLFSPQKGKAKNQRRDVSDSEVEVKKSRKPLKSHSSDTEFENSRIRQTPSDDKQKQRKKNQPKEKLTANLKEKVAKNKDLADTQDKKVKRNETQPKKLTRKNIQDLKEVKDNAEKIKVTKAGSKKGAK